MTTLTPGKIFRSRTPSVTVENALKPGAWRFRLTVVDNDGNESAPAELVVTVRERVVRDPTGPVRVPIGPVLSPVLTPVRPIPVPDPAPVVNPVITPVLTPVRTPTDPTTPTTPTKPFNPRRPS